MFVYWITHSFSNISHCSMKFFYKNGDNDKLMVQNTRSKRDKLLYTVKLLLLDFFCIDQLKKGLGNVVRSQA